MTAKEQGLPELPEPHGWYLLTGHGNSYSNQRPQCLMVDAWKPAYGAAQMRAYALAALASDTGEREVVGLWVRDENKEACSDGCCGGCAFTHAEEAALRAQPAGGGDGWFSVDVDALMEAATRAMTNCNFYAEIDGVAYSRLPTKDMTALGDVIMKAIGEKA